MRLAAVLNMQGGTLRTLDSSDFITHVKRAFAEVGDDVEVMMANGGDLPELLEEAFENDDFKGVLVAGGDGSISLAASLAWRSGKLLIPVPAGTMNLFTRSFQIPADVYEAVHALAQGRDMQCDIATANDQPFVHQFSVGLHPKLVRMRASIPYRSRIGKMLASTRAALFAFRKIRPVKASIKLVNDEIEEADYGLIAVSNNLYGAGHLPFADRMNGGKLGLYTVPPMPFSGLVALALAVMGGQWKRHPDISVKTAQQVKLEFADNKKKLRASVDGELRLFDKNVALKIHEKAFTVRIPDHSDLG